MTRSYPTRASSAGSGDRSSQRACYLANFIARFGRSESQDFCVIMTKNRDKNRLQLTGQKQKRESGEFKGKGVTNQVFSNHISALNSININVLRCSWCIIVDGRSTAECMRALRFQKRANSNTTSILPNQWYLIFNNLVLFRTMLHLYS